MRRCLALSLALVASPAIAAHCPHGQLWRVHQDKCVSLSSPAALAYQSPSHWVNQRIEVRLPEPPEPPLRPEEIPSTVPDVDPDIIDIPLTEPDPATMALKQQLEKK
jgi:hypothetical protein